MKKFTDTVWHRWLRVPYTLHAHLYHNPRRYRETVVLLHGIGNSTKAWKDIASYIPSDVRVIAVDLLGFGGSPKPSWVVYNTRTQSRAVIRTLLHLGVKGKVILVGHSLGALVAVRFGRDYPLLVKRMVLCSPPVYRPTEDGKLIGSRDDRLRRLYKIAKKYPAQLLSLAPLAVQLGIANKALTINDDNIASYLATLEMSIIEQTAADDIRRIRKPITIFHGLLDPVVIGGNLKKLADEHSMIEYKTILTGHEIMGEYAKRVGLYLADILKNSTK